jgi:hypothetical protein
MVALGRTNPKCEVDSLEVFAFSVDAEVFALSVNDLRNALELVVNVLLNA